MNVTCDKCKNNFNIDLKIKYYYGLEIQYFICPNCGKKYYCTVIDEYIRGKRKEFNKIKDKINKCTKQKQVNRLVKEQQSILKMMKKHSDDFIKRLEGTQ